MTTAARTRAATVLDLRDPAAVDPSLTGAKAANLAIAAQLALPVLPGFVLTTEASSGADLAPVAVAAVRAAWTRITESSQAALVVRSSSSVEDIAASSMAGQFTSVLDVRGWDAFLAAVTTVLASALHPHDQSLRARPMAVLVQPQVDASCGGVLFGIDPVTGDRRHVVVEAVPRGPDAVVSGAERPVHAVLSRRGRFLEGTGPSARALLTPTRRARLVRLAAAAARAFGAPQDIEWAFDPADRLWLLQSRPVTAASEEAFGPVLGPGPVAETFPEPLRRLEEDLWVAPLRDGVVGALLAIGIIPRRRLRRSAVVTTVHGRIAADLELLGVVPRRRGRAVRLDPREPARRVLASWRVGRLRAALPDLAADVVDAVDASLAATPALHELRPSELVDVVDTARDQLVALHGHEVLAGMLLAAGGGGDGGRVSVAARALDAVARGREDGLDDAAIIARAPVVLALLPPRISVRPPLPAKGVLAPAGAGSEFGWRDALRLRSRWVQELIALAVVEIAARVAPALAPLGAEAVRDLAWDELRGIVAGGSVPPDLAARAASVAGPPLPVAFRMTASGDAVAVRGLVVPDGLAAGGGRAEGHVVHRRPEAEGHSGDADSVTATCRADRPILVVETLDPQLAGELPHIAGLVAETGSALSHLAILAREMGVATVVAVPDARTRFPPGTRVLVDGSTGVVEQVPARPGRGEVDR